MYKQYKPTKVERPYHATCPLNSLKKQRTSAMVPMVQLSHDWSMATTSATRGHDEGLQKEEVPAALHGVPIGFF